MNLVGQLFEGPAGGDDSLRAKISLHLNKMLAALVLTFVQKITDFKNQSIVDQMAEQGAAK